MKESENAVESSEELNVLIEKRDRAHRRVIFLTLETIPVFLIPALVAVWVGQVWSRFIATRGQLVENSLDRWPIYVCLVFSFVFSWLFIWWRFTRVRRNLHAVQKEIAAERARLGIPEPESTWDKD